MKTKYTLPEGKFYVQLKADASGWQTHGLAFDTANEALRWADKSLPNGMVWRVVREQQDGSLTVWVNEQNKVRRMQTNIT